MFSLTNLLLIIIAYLLGSIPTAVWVGKIFYGKDIRQFGSKNAGAANTFRILGVKAGIPVLLIDIFKGFAAVNLVRFSDLLESGNEDIIIFKIILGIAAVIGHILPVYAGFRGGKGVATIAGFVLAIHPMAAIISLGIFLIVLLIMNYVSLASITAGISFPLIIIFVYRTNELSLIIFSAMVSVLLIITHRNNIKRLIKGNESKANLFKKRSKTTSGN